MRVLLAFDAKLSSQCPRVAKRAGFSLVKVTNPIRGIPLHLNSGTL